MSKTFPFRALPSKSLLVILVTLAGTGCSAFGIQNVEEAGYRVMREEGRFELRLYEDLAVVETSVEGGYDRAGRTAFDRLFGYISGENIERSKIAMTAPVITEPQNRQEGVKVAMTAPVVSEEAGDGWRVAFVLPSSFTPETAPLPTNPLVELATIPSKRVAAVRFSGFLNEEKVKEYADELRAWIEESGLTPTSEPRSAGYDPPWTVPFLRRNEVMIDVASRD